MIRMVFALRRKSGMSVADFQEHLVRKYGPLMASFGDVLGARKYVQSVTLDGDPATMRAGSRAAAARWSPRTTRSVKSGGIRWTN